VKNDCIFDIHTILNKLYGLTLLEMKLTSCGSRGEILLLVLKSVNAVYNTQLWLQYTGMIDKVIPEK